GDLASTQKSCVACIVLRENRHIVLLMSAAMGSAVFHSHKRQSPPVLSGEADIWDTRAPCAEIRSNNSLKSTKLESASTPKKITAQRRFTDLGIGRSRCVYYN